MAHAESGSPLSDLLGGLASDISGLFRKEIQLAKAEAGEKLDNAIAAGRSLAIGGVLAIGALGVFLAAMVTGLTAMFVNMGWSEAPANFAAAMLVTVVGAIAWAMIARGTAQLKANKLNMNRTAHSLQMDATAVRETLS